MSATVPIWVWYLAGAVTVLVLRAIYIGWKISMLKFGPKRKPRTPAAVIVHFDDHAGKTFMQRIDIPKGWQFKHGFASVPALVNETGEVEQEWRWIAGYTVSYEFIYE
jgi:hypothetical protein